MGCTTSLGLALATVRNAGFFTLGSVGAGPPLPRGSSPPSTLRRFAPPLPPSLSLSDESSLRTNPSAAFCASANTALACASSASSARLRSDSTLRLMAPRAESSVTLALRELSDRISSSAAMMSISRLLSLVLFSSAAMAFPSSSSSRSRSASSSCVALSRHGS